MSTCVKSYDNFLCSIFIGFEKLFEFLICPGTLPESQFSSVIQSCPTFCHPIDHSTPGLPVHHQLSEFTQTYVHWVGDAIQSSHVVPFSSCPQSCPASGSFQMSQLFASSVQSIGVSASTSVLPMNIQDWFPLGWTGWSPCSPSDSQKHQFFSTQLSL